MKLPHPLTGELFESPVPPGTGWPEDPAVRRTPVAHDRDDVRRLAAPGKRAAAAELRELEARVSVCRACPRLVQWRGGGLCGARGSVPADPPLWGPRPRPGASPPPT